jgi:hypothetical protein
MAPKTEWTTAQRTAMDTKAVSLAARITSLVEQNFGRTALEPGLTRERVPLEVLKAANELVWNLEEYHR